MPFTLQKLSFGLKMYVTYFPLPLKVPSPLPLKERPLADKSSHPWFKATKMALFTSSFSTLNSGKQRKLILIYLSADGKEETAQDSGPREGVGGDKQNKEEGPRFLKRGHLSQGHAASRLRAHRPAAWPSPAQVSCL